MNEPAIHKKANGTLALTRLCVGLSAGLVLIDLVADVSESKAYGHGIAFRVFVALLSAFGIPAVVSLPFRLVSQRVSQYVWIGTASLLYLNIAYLLAS